MLPVVLPGPATVISWPDDEANDPSDVVPLKVNKKSLRFCATVVGLTSKLYKVTLTWPAVVVNTACASTGLPPDSVAPGVVSKVNDPACAAIESASSGKPIWNTFAFVILWCRVRLT